MSTSSCRIAGRNPFAGSSVPSALRSLWLLAAAAMLVACGGGGSGSSGTGALPPSTGSPSNPPPSNPPPASKGSVVVRAITSAGVPVNGISVTLNGGFDGRSVVTDANGEALFKDIPPGDASTNTYGLWYHPAYRRLSVSDGALTRVTVTLLPKNEAVPVLLATHPAKPSADGRRLTVEVDLAVLTADGSSRAGLVPGDFGLEGACGWYPCVFEADGRDTNAGYYAHATAAVFSTTAVPPGASSAVGVLVDQSSSMGRWDPVGWRTAATREYFDRVLPPNLVTLASHHYTGATPVLTTYGGFTSDGSRFRDALNGLWGQEAGDSLALEAIAEMAGFMSASIAGATGSPRQAMVVMSSRDCGFSTVCLAGLGSQSWQAAVDAARAAGITVIVVGDDMWGGSVALATGGASVDIQHPSQYSPVFRALDLIVLGGLSHYRVHLELDAGAPGVFVEGRRVRGELTIRLGTDTQLFLWNLTIPI